MSGPVSTRPAALGALVLCCLLFSAGAFAAVGSGTAAAASGQANVTVVAETTDGALCVDVRITNEGEATGRYTVELVEDGEVVGERDLRVPPDGTRQTTFDVEVAGTTAYAVYVNGVEVETLTVTAPVNSSTARDDRLPGPVAVGLLGGAVLLVAGLVLFRLT